MSDALRRTTGGSLCFRLGRFRRPKSVRDRATGEACSPRRSCAVTAAPRGLCTEADASDQDGDWLRNPTEYVPATAAAGRLVREDGPPACGAFR